MYRKQLNAQSPMRILEKSIHGGLGKGNLGVVMAPAGVGKSACLVQIGLDDLMRDKDVLHVAIGQTVEHVSAWYEALFDDLAEATGLDDRDGVRAGIARHRVIKAFAESDFSSKKLSEALKMFGEHLKLKPAAILVDGFDWAKKEHRDELQAIKRTAQETGAELWMTAQTPRGWRVNHPKKVTPPCEDCANLIDVGLFLEPKGSHVEVRLVKDHGENKPSDTHLQLHCDTLRLVAEGETPSHRAMPARAHRLLSGGADGAETEFGTCAEKWGLAERNFTFPGRTPPRTRGLVQLTDEELKLGDVSSAYLKAHMHRTYPDAPMFKKVLQSIWHQVNTAGEVFAIGQINEDNTVTGGTGWAVELAKHWNKRVCVYDQEKRGWYLWKNEKWAPVKNPKIEHGRFCGTGTRHLSDHGREAIRQLFERSFGKPE